MKNFRAPATPLITVDPYFNIWSFADTLYGDTPRHWTGQRHFLTGIVTIDGEPLKFMGMLNPDNLRYRTEPEVIEQISCEIRPMTTKYVFENEKVTLRVDFMTPLIPDDLYLMSRPISYIFYGIEAKDGKPHDIEMYIDVSCELCVNTPDRAITLGKTDYSLTASSGTDSMLVRSGDDHRIEWGTLHLIAPGFETYFIDAANKAAKFRRCVESAKYTQYRNVECGSTIRPQDGWTALACQKTYGSTKKAEDFICIGYDDIKSIQYFGENIEAYWRRDGAQFEDIFRETVRINTLDYVLYRDIQQKLIDVLDQGTSVHIRGAHGNETDLTVALHPLKDPAKETLFENCVADVNIPVGEVFTSPQLAGTNGLLHVSQVYLNELKYVELKVWFKDGRIENWSCGNFADDEANRNYFFENVMYHHETLPLGEFAIGTNTAAYCMAQKYQIADKLPILIAEKMGPHFAVGDTCYSWAEDTPVYNPDGKEIIARDNEVSILRKEDPSRAYFGCHTDITIPYEELGSIEVIRADGSRIPVISGGRFVVPGTEALNESLDEAGK